MDTGTPINIIDESTWSRMTPPPTLQACGRQYYGFQSQKPLPVIGQFVARLEYKSRSTQAAFIVLRGYTEQLISYQTAIDLRMISVPADQSAHSEVIALVNIAPVLSTDELDRRFPSAFSGKLR